MDTNVDEKRRRFLTQTTSVVGGVGVLLAAVPFASSFQPSERAKAVGAPVEVDISKLEEGQRIIEKWRGKPVWIVRRSAAVLEALEGLDDALRDPASEKEQQPEYAKNIYRSIRPEVLVVVGLCTHLGCSPLYVTDGGEYDLGEDWHGGFFCPCHGSRFDMAGRVYSGVPAPSNMVVPPHKFISETRVIIGEDEETA